MTEPLCRKTFELSIQKVKVQISSRIDLVVVCQCNDSALAVSSIQRVDQVDRVADFRQEKLRVDLSHVGGRLRSQAAKANLSGSLLDMNTSLQTEAPQKHDLLVCTLKLFAVKEKD